MAKELVKPSSDSSLSPLPDNLGSATELDATQGAINGKKRKATHTEASTKRTKRAPVKKVEPEESGKIAAEITSEAPLPLPRRRATKRVATKEDTTDESELEKDDTAKVKAKKPAAHTNRSIDEGGKATVVKKAAKRKPKVTKNTEPIAQRTTDTRLRVGAHVSAAGGVQNAVVNLIHIGGNAFALFLKNHRKWESVDLDPEAAELFIDGCKEYSIDVAGCCVPHGSYLVNLAHPDAARKKQAYDAFVNDLVRCNRLGIKFYNFHPGNANATTREEGIRLIAENLNEAHLDPATGNVVSLLETMATLGNTIGGTFADLAAIIKLVKDKSRVGVCLDTCHVFAAGYDLRTPEAYTQTMQKFDKEIGLEYLKAFHVNDSKAPLFSNRDLHARIGTGYLGLQSFHNLVNDERFHGLPMVLETPNEVVGEDGKKTEDKGVWAREIKLLESLVGMDVKSDEFKDMEAKLQDEGKGERERVGDQFERKKAKAAAPKKKRGSKKTEGEDDEDMD